MASLFKPDWEMLSSLDPKRIYVENVRHFLGLNTRSAEWLCEKAVRDGLFEKWISYEHPKRGHSLAESPADAPLDPDEIVKCDVSAENEDEETEFRVSQLVPREFYKSPVLRSS